MQYWTRFSLSSILAALLLTGLVFSGILHCSTDKQMAPVFADADKSLRQARQEIVAAIHRDYAAIQLEANAYKTPYNQNAVLLADRLLHMADAYCAFLDSLKLVFITKTLGQPPGMNQSLKTDSLSGADWAQLMRHERSNEDPVKMIEFRSGPLCTLYDSIRQQTDNSAAQCTLDFKALEHGQFQLGSSHHNIYGMPVAAVITLLSDLQVRAMAQTWAGVKMILSELGQSIFCCFGCTDFRITAPSSFMIPGESYHSDIYLADFYGLLYCRVLDIKINGSSIPVRDGIAHYEQHTSTLGRKTCTADITVARIRKDHSGLLWDTIRLQKEFSYVVGNNPPTVKTFPAPFLYAGVENPITLNPRYGLTPHRTKVVGQGAKVRRTGPGQFVVVPDKPGQLALTVDIGCGVAPSVYTYDVRPLPNPEPVLGDSLSGGQVAHQSLRLQQYISVRFPDNFDFPGLCTVETFQLTRLRPREDEEELTNRGSTFSHDVRRLLENTLPGDRILFHDIQIRCPGDQAARRIGSMVFQSR